MERDCMKSLDDLDHPCRQACSGWKQGYDKGYRDSGSEFLEYLLSSINTELPVFGDKTALQYVAENGEKSIDFVIGSFKRIYT